MYDAQEAYDLRQAPEYYDDFDEVSLWEQAIEQYRDAAIECLKQCVADGDIIAFDEQDIEEMALELAWEAGEHPEQILKNPRAQWWEDD